MDMSGLEHAENGNAGSEMLGNECAGDSFVLHYPLNVGL